MVAYKNTPSFIHGSYLCTWHVNLSVSFSPFKFVVLWIQGWILFCSEACAFNNCSMFVEWMDEWAIMGNITFSCHTALKPFLVSHQMDFPPQESDRYKIDRNTWHFHLLLNIQQGSFCLTCSLWFFFWKPSNSLRQPCPSLHKSYEKNRLTWALYF